MPIYAYETLVGASQTPSRFEVGQRMANPPRTDQPETAESVRRVGTAPALGLPPAAGRQQDVLSDQNLARHGFTRYERAERGTYERTAGTLGTRGIRAADNP